MSEALSSNAGRAVRWRLAQLIGVNAIFLLRIVVLAMLLEPDAFGLLAIALVPIGIILQASELGMIPALVHAEAPERRHYDTAWTIGFFRGFGAGALVFLLAPAIADLAQVPAAADVTRVLALQPVLLGLSSVRVADLQRKLDFRPLAFLHLGEAIANTLAAIALASTFGVWALVAGMLAGNLARVVISFVVAPHPPRLSFHRAASRSLIRFGQWVFVAAMLSTIGGALLRLVISRELGAAEVGLYYLATRLTFIVGGTAIDVGSSVAFPIYARLKEATEEAVRVFRAVLTATMALIVPPFALLVALAPTLVSDVLGPEWQGTAPVLQVLSLVCILSVFGDVTGPIWHGMGQPWRNALIEAVQSSVLLAGAWLLAPRVGVVGAALAWIPATISASLLSAVFLPRVLPRPMSGVARPTLAVVGTAGLGAAVARLVSSGIPGFAGAVVAAVAGAGVALGLLWVGDRFLDLGLEASLRRVFPSLPWGGGAARGGASS